ncbi:MAG: NAD-dependent epimerase/dehydratase family protein [Bacteroidales bacterium]
MTKQKILITGGAGFIGSHLCDLLIEEGHYVRVLDNLDPQVHGKNARRPDYLHPGVQLIIGDVRNPEDVKKALKEIDIVYHFAAKVGVGQSMYEIGEYTAVNNVGTAVLLEALINNPPQKLLVASSMSIYGEGLYRGPEGEIIDGFDRKLEDLKRGEWELYNEQHEKLIPIATHEGKTPALSSVYALSKYDQERLCLIAGRAYNFPVTALRFFNVYGTRQALSNPYTGVLAIFASRYLNERLPLIFEDGEQLRDFVHVSDIARACYAASDTGKANGEVLNIGSGKSYSVNFIAEALAQVMGKDYLKPEVTGKYRSGDIRHCFADIRKAQSMIGYQPHMTLNEGLASLAEWLEGQIAYDHVDTASKELEKRGLAV